MEVASPLPFAAVQAGTKRPFACSPGHSPLHGMETTAEEFGFAQQTFKRRRFNSNENMDSTLHNTSSSSLTSSRTTNFFSGMAQQSNNDTSLKRDRSELSDGAGWSHTDEAVNDLKRVVDTQRAEIDSLKADKATLESSLNETRSAHDKAVNENRILKRAVTIQQERQNHAASEIEAASRFKVEADEKIQRLEHMCLTLQYHLQAQNKNMPGNDFMGCPPRPPDVY